MSFSASLPLLTLSIYFEVIQAQTHCCISTLSFTVTCCWVVAKDGKKVREKIRKIASKVEEEDFTEDLDMVTTSLSILWTFFLIYLSYLFMCLHVCIVD